MTEPIKTLQEIRDYVFGSAYKTAIIGLKPDCTDEQFIQAAMNLTEELHIQIDVQKYVINREMNKK
jgi:hypothetical protein